LGAAFFAGAAGAAVVVVELDFSAVGGAGAAAAGFAGAFLALLP